MKDNIYGAMIFLGALIAIIGGTITTGLVGIVMMVYGEWKLGLITDEEEEQQQQ